MPEPLNPYFQEIALDLIKTRHLAVPSDPQTLGAWIGRASAVMAEALRVAGNDEGIDAIIGVFGDA